ncbi:MAG TPA: hypothetical protein VLH12_08390 [Usitatibacter sp.]|nr:hypothetical protein [Usitatibacter sp.]
MTVRLTILGEPASKANRRQLVTFGRGEEKRPALIKSKKALGYERDAQRQIPHSARVMFTGPLRVTLHIYYASERPDLDESVVLDVLQARYGKGGKKGGDLIRAGVYVNDRQVREKHVYQHVDKSNPRTEIEVEEIEVEEIESTLFTPEQMAAIAPAAIKLAREKSALIASYRSVAPGADPF